MPHLFVEQDFDFELYGYHKYIKANNWINKVNEKKFTLIWLKWSENSKDINTILCYRNENFLDQRFWTYIYIYFNASGSKMKT